MLNELILTTHDGRAIPMMTRKEAIAQGLIPGKARKNAQLLYDFKLTLPYALPAESDMLINACTNLAQGNRRYLVVYENTSAIVYISTSIRASPQLSPEDRTTIGGLFQEIEDAAPLEEVS